jgi:hypothetical protein
MAHYKEVLEATIPGSAEHLADHVSIFHTRSSDQPTTSLEVTAMAWLRQNPVLGHLHEIAAYGRAMKPYMGGTRDSILLTAMATGNRISDEAFRWMARWETLRELSKLTSIPQESWAEAMEKLTTLDENLE